MTIPPMSEWSDRAGVWAPAIVVLLIWLLILPTRLIGLFLLPRNSKFMRHPWHAAYALFAFEW